LSPILRFFIAVLFTTYTLTFCTSAYKLSKATEPTKEAKKEEPKDRKALKTQIEKQEEKRKGLDELEHKDRTPTQRDKYKKGTPKSPETYY
jgi:hypothetical protein